MCMGCRLHDWLRRIYALTEDLATFYLTAVIVKRLGHEVEVACRLTDDVIR